MDDLLHKIIMFLLHGISVVKYLYITGDAIYNLSFEKSTYVTVSQLISSIVCTAWTYFRRRKAVALIHSSAVLF